MFASNTLVPAMMHTSIESRQEALKVYDKLPSNGYRQRGRHRDTYVRWATDIIIFEDIWGLQAMLAQGTGFRHDISKYCQKLAVVRKYDNILIEFLRCQRYLLFPMLREFTFIMNAVSMPQGSGNLVLQPAASSLLQRYITAKWRFQLRELPPGCHKLIRATYKDVTRDTAKLKSSA
jgi:hypothetical protein